MTMQAPKTELEIEEFQRQQKQLKRDHTIGLVDPQGIVREVICGPELDEFTGYSRGVDVVRYIEGEIRLRKWAREKGWTLLEDRCREDGCPELYDNWRHVVHARMDGEIVHFDPKDLYPPSVLAQRKRGGKAEVKPKRFVPGKGLVDLEDAPQSEEATKRRVGRLATEMGLEPKEE